MRLRDLPPMAERDRFRLVQRRIKAGMSQVKVAEALGVHWKSISNWEQGRSNPTMENRKAWASLFRVRLTRTT